MLNKNPAGLIASGVFLCLFCYANVSADAYLTQNLSPFVLIHGLPQPASATLPDKASIDWSVGLDITNTLNAESNAAELLYVDYESYLLRYSLSYGLTENCAIKLDIPFIEYSSGFLDSQIDTWHRWFGLPRADRPNVMDNSFRIAYDYNGNSEINLTSSTGGLADIQLGLGYQLLNNPGAALAFWLIADLPTGEQDKLTGNNELDASLLIAGKKQLSTNWNSYANLGLLFPGSQTLVTAPVEKKVWFGHAGLQWSVHELVSLQIQLNGNTGLYKESHLKFLDDAYSFVFGGTVYFSRCSDLDIAVSEDLKVGATPDVSFLMTWKSRSGHCR